MNKTSFIYDSVSQIIINMKRVILKSMVPQLGYLLGYHFPPLILLIDTQFN